MAEKAPPMINAASPEPNLTEWSLNKYAINAAVIAAPMEMGPESSGKWVFPALIAAVNPNRRETGSNISNTV